MKKKASKNKPKAKKQNNAVPFTAKSIVPSKKARGFTTKRPAKAHLSYPL